MSDKDIKIRSISKQGKKYAVITSKETLVFDEDTLIKYNVFPNQVFNENEFKKIKSDLEINNLFNRTLNFLSYQRRTVYEIENYLTKHKASQEAKEVILKRLNDFGYLDDFDYAKDYLKYQSEVKLKGPHFIKTKLQQKGVPENIIQDILMEYSESLQGENIKIICDKALLKESTLPVIKIKQNLSHKLIRSGYQPAMVYEYVNSLDIEDNSEESLIQEFKKVKQKYQNRDLNEYEERTKIINSLIRKGYSYSQVLKMFNNFE